MCCKVIIGLTLILVIALTVMIICFLVRYESFIGGLSMVIELMTLGVLLVGVGY